MTHFMLSAVSKFPTFITRTLYICSCYLFECLRMKCFERQVNAFGETNYLQVACHLTGLELVLNSSYSYLKI